MNPATELRLDGKTLQGAAFSGRDQKGECRLKVDAIVVGLGAGGSVVLNELAQRGFSVCGLEQGGFHSQKDFNQREDEMFSLLFQDSGARTTTDMAIRVLQGKGVGGSTVHNTNICKRIPDEILLEWNKEHGLPQISPDLMRPYFEKVERDLSVSEIPEDFLNGNNRALQKGTKALGYSGGMLKHNRVGCVQSGFCELGCAYNAKQNALKIYIPEALRHGARIYSDATVVEVLHHQNRVVGVWGYFSKSDGGRGPYFRIEAPRVVLAASATSSAAIAIRSGLKDPYRRQGKQLRLHPAAVVAGVFDDPVSSDLGIPQSYECTEFLNFGSEKDSKRIWILTAFAHPIGVASMLSGFGKAHMRSMRLYKHLAVFCAMVHDTTEGQVYLHSNQKMMMNYRMNLKDLSQLRLGILECAKLMRAAGAKEVIVPGVKPKIIRSETDLKAMAVDLSFIAPHEIPLSSVHPMGSMSMGSDPASSVVNGYGEHHHVKGLYVADASLFPSSLGVPPQIGIYSFAHFVSSGIL